MSDARVLVCAYACAPPESSEFAGGEELLGWRMACEIGRRYDADVLVSDRYRASVESAETPPDVRWHFIGLPKFLRPLLGVQGALQLYAYLWQIRAWRLAERLHTANGYDLFHHVTYANDWMASYIGAFLDVPYVRGPAGGAQRVPSELLSNYSLRFRLSQRLRSILQSILRLDPVFRLGQHRARTLLMCTPEVAGAVSDHLRDKTVIMPVVGVTERNFQVTALSGKAEPFTVLTAGKLLKHKGFDLAVRAFAEFRKSADNARLKVVGEGPEYEALCDLATSRGVESDVELSGWLSHPELLSEMAAADVFLFPSLRDGGGAVVVEAMATGTPVVCLDVAGPGLHVTPETGIKVPARCADEVVDDLVRSLERLHEDTILRRRLGRGARKRAWKLYRWDRHGERIANVYDAILQDQQSLSQVSSFLTRR